jgi:hypothetical protein
VLVLAAAIGGTAFLVHKNRVLPAVGFEKVDLHSVLNLLGGLFVVALMAERAVEVIISVLRDADAQEMQDDINAVTAELAAAKAAVLPVQADIDAFAKVLAAEQKTLGAYRIDTKETSYCISFVLGLALALVGVRGLHGVLAGDPSSGWFKLVDIVVTGAMIAGGSDGIHQMLSAITDCFNMVSKKATAKTDG